MAVLDGLPGLEVSIHMDGQQLKEYDDNEGEEIAQTPIAEYQAAKTVRKFVESVSDKEFSVRIVVQNPFKMDYDSLKLPIYIDGKWCRDPVVVKTDWPTKIQGSRFLSAVTRKVTGVKVSAPGNEEKELLRKFKFSKINTTTDDDDLATIHNDMNRIKAVGEIVIKAYRGGESTIPTKNHSVKSTDLHGAEDKVHEKALKGDAKSHSISFGPATELVAKNNQVNCKKLDGEDYPIAIFRFKYRSRDALKSLLIIERSPSPEPAEVPAPEPGLSLDNLNATQKTRLEQFLRDLVNDGDSGRNTPNRTVKRERDENEGNEASQRKKRSRPPVTIDLTDD